MSFNSITFIWLFLPVVIGGYFLISIIPGKLTWLKNLFLVIVSMFFYLWGDIKAAPFLIGIIVLGWGTGILIEKLENKKGQCLLLGVSVILLIGILGYYKYWNFLADNLERLIGTEIPHVSGYFPLGISFIVFQSIAYLVDIYRKDVRAQRNIVSVALYFSFFPQLVTGPIVRYPLFEGQLEDRTISIEGVVSGIKRFIVGLGKKVIIADCLGQVVDTILAFDSQLWGTIFSWIVFLGYSMQIYYDFSGYTDMALGLGKAFGFELPENFNLPYTAKSVQELWRRWHITLSNWFRDYVYIPLGGNRKGNIRTYINLSVVFALTGLWHGASWNFIFWGMWHGMFMLIERAWLGQKLKNCKYPVINYLYTITVTFVGWMFFRITSLTQAFHLLKLLVVPTAVDTRLSTHYFINPYTITVLVAGIMLCGPMQALYKRVEEKIGLRTKSTLEFIGLSVVFVYSLCQVVSSTYSAFIYQQF